VLSADADSEFCEKIALHLLLLDASPAFIANDDACLSQAPTGSAFGAHLSHHLAFARRIFQCTRRHRYDTSVEL